jgi:hypothetical protein
MEIPSSQPFQQNKDERQSNTVEAGCAQLDFIDQTPEKMKPQSCRNMKDPNDSFAH